jgi:branched-chain amino acid transport system substrate-binding protein
MPARTRLSALALAVLVSVLAGCASDDGSSADTTTTTVDLGPDTGDGVLALSTAGAEPTVQAAVELARQDIDDGGGVLGEPLTVVRRGPSDAVIGPDTIDGVLSFVADPGAAGAATDLVFTTSPPAALRAEATAQVLVADDVTEVAVLGDADLTHALDAHGVTVSTAEDVDQVVATEPEAVVLPIDADTADRIAALLDSGYSTGDHAFYLAGDRVDPALGFAIGDRPGVLDGVRAVQPGAEVDEDLRIRLFEVDRGLDDLSGAPEAYDAVVIAALAAEAAGTDDPDFVAAEVGGITHGGDTCTGYEECRAYLEEGTDITYVGLGGAYDLDDAGVPTRSAFSVFEYGGDNLVDPNRSEYLVATNPDD